MRSHWKIRTAAPAGVELENRCKKIFIRSTKNAPERGRSRNNKTTS
jgi:hypothetical protein